MSQELLFGVLRSEAEIKQSLGVWAWTQAWCPHRAGLGPSTLWLTPVGEGKGRRRWWCVWAPIPWQLGAARTLLWAITCLKIDIWSENQGWLGSGCSLERALALLWVCSSKVINTRRDKEVWSSVSKKGAWNRAETSTRWAPVGLGGQRAKVSAHDTRQGLGGYGWGQR